MISTSYFLLLGFFACLLLAVSLLKESLCFLFYISSYCLAYLEGDIYKDQQH